MEDMMIEELIGEMISYDAEQPCDLAAVSLLEDEDLVIVYDRNREKHYLQQLKEGNVKEVVTCYIPQKHFILHTRCYACRGNEHGDFDSLKDGDEQIVHRYF